MILENFFCLKEIELYSVIKKNRGVEFFLEHRQNIRLYACELHSDSLSGKVGFLGMLAMEHGSLVYAIVIHWKHWIALSGV